MNNCCKIEKNWTYTPIYETRFLFTKFCIKCHTNLDTIDERDYPEIFKDDIADMKKRGIYIEKIHQEGN